MARRHSHHGHLLVLFSTLSIFLRIANAQIGTITQDITTMAAYSNQKECARSCFQYTGFCNNDVLGSEIGCATYGCSKNGWQAKNDCYCRADLQGPAQSALTDCIQSMCTVGDVSIDAASAGSIYGLYCQQKGYTPAAEPATVSAQTTGAGATKTGGLAGPTSSTSSGGSSSSKSNKLSTTEIVGIAAGGLAGLAFLSVVLKILLRNCSCWNKPPKFQQHLPPPIQQQQPFYPPSMPAMPQSYYGAPTFPHHGAVDADGISPDDSVSMISGMPQVANPTLISDARSGYPRRY